MVGYSVSVVESSKELSAKEKVMLKDVSNAIKLDEATQNGKVIIKPVAYVVLSIHNEKSDNKDYENYLIIDENNDKYVTGSASFWNSFCDIWSDMTGEDEEWMLECYRLPSKNYKGKDFLTCSIA